MYAPAFRAATREPLAVPQPFVNYRELILVVQADGSGVWVTPSSFELLAGEPVPTWHDAVLIAGRVRERTRVRVTA